jgi:hypothetical protein
MPTRSLWKFVLTVLVLLPFLPAISVYTAAGLAKIKGCSVGEEETCVARAISVSRAIVEMPQVSPGLPVVLLVGLTWLAFGYMCVILGWSRAASRLLIGFSLTVIFAGLPYFASLPVLGSFVEPHCKPYGGGFGVCGLFDGNVGSSGHILLVMVWLSFIGLPFGPLAFLIYSLVVIASSKSCPQDATGPKFR